MIVNASLKPSKLTTSSCRNKKAVALKVLSGRTIPHTFLNARLLSNGCVVDGTAWVLSREELQGQFDYLLVDEAGQFSLGNAVGTGSCADNIVLMGDQMQLASPIQGSHPSESGMSAL